MCSVWPSQNSNQKGCTEQCLLLLVPSAAQACVDWTSSSGAAKRTSTSQHTLPLCRLVIFGGRSQEKKRLNDVHFLDTETWTWHKAVTEGAVPVPRCSASAVIMEGQLILFGGSAAGGP